MIALTEIGGWLGSDVTETQPVDRDDPGREGAPPMTWVKAMACRAGKLLGSCLPGRSLNLYRSGGVLNRQAREGRGRRRRPPGHGLWWQRPRVQVALPEGVAQVAQHAG